MSARNASVALLLALGCAAPVSDARVTAGTFHTCVLRDSELRCFGLDRFGAVTGAERLLGSIVDVGAGGETTCAVDRAGAVFCFGHNHHGQLGDPSLSPSTSPLRVSLPMPAREVAVGAAHACSRHDDGTVCCWGWNGLRQVSDEEVLDVLEPRCWNDRALEVSVGWASTCTIDVEGRLRCRGAIAELGGQARAVAIGVDHGCAVRDGGLECVGLPGAAADTGARAASLCDRGRSARGGGGRSRLRE